MGGNHLEAGSHCPDRVGECLLKAWRVSVTSSTCSHIGRELGACALGHLQADPWQGSFQLCVLLVMNVAMQAIFVGIAWFNFFSASVDSWMK